MSSQEYTISRVQDAIKQANGNLAQAQRILTDWSIKDQGLLIGLVAPHLKGIVMHAISHENNKKFTTEEVSSEEVDTITSELSEALGQNKRNMDEFGQTPKGVAGKPKQASQEHVNAIYKLAKNIDKE